MLTCNLPQQFCTNINNNDIPPFSYAFNIPAHARLVWTIEMRWPMDSCVQVWAAAYRCVDRCRP